METMSRKKKGLLARLFADEPKPEEPKHPPGESYDGPEPQYQPACRFAPLEPPSNSQDAVYVTR
jgi:hypothetical protein